MVRTLITRCATGLAVALLACPGAAHAGAYTEPQGFNGHRWGDEFTGFKGLVLWHVNTAAGARGKVTDFSIECVQDPATGSTCSTALSRVQQRVEGEGSHVLAEYYFDKDINPWFDKRVELHTISYLFCARVAGDGIPRNVRKRLALCGVRMKFRSDTAAMLARHDADYESNFDRLLHQMIAEHGVPPGYVQRASVSVDALDPDVPDAHPPQPPFVHYRWCGVNLSDNKLNPSCRATVSLAFESATGMGTVLYATGPLYEFSYAVHELGDENNELFRLIAERPLDQRYPKRRDECTGRHICSPGSSPMTAEQMRTFDP